MSAPYAVVREAAPQDLGGHSEPSPGRNGADDFSPCLRRVQAASEESVGRADDFCQSDVGEPVHPGRSPAGCGALHFLNVAPAGYPGPYRHEGAFVDG